MRWSISLLGICPPPPPTASVTIGFTRIVLLAQRWLGLLVTLVPERLLERLLLFRAAFISDNLL